MSSVVNKKRKKTPYEKHFDVRKKLMLWIPPSVEQAYFDDPDSPTIMYLIYLIESEMVKRIDTQPYDDSFQIFYDSHLEQYNTSETNFCAKYSEDGGVNPEYIVNSANCAYDDNNITLLSLDTDEYGNIKDVYGLITFHLLEHKPDTIMVETLCGNRTLEPSGEGTRLINYLKNKAYEVGITKIALHPLDNVIGYYTRLNFRKLNSDEADDINLSDAEDTTMAINVRARKNWNKLRTTAKVLGKFMRNRSKQTNAEKTRKIIKEIYEPKYDEKTGKRGTPIHRPFSQPTMHYVPHPARVGKVVDVKIDKHGTVEVSKLATPIIPGASMQLIKERDAILTAAQMTQLRNQHANKKALYPINEESSIQKLSQSQIDEEANKNIEEEEKNALKIFENAKTQVDKKRKAKGTRKRKPKRRV